MDKRDEPPQGAWEKGFQAGVEEGSKKRSFDVARKLIQKGMPLDMIWEIIEVAQKDIDQLLEPLH